jgi:hypothetical protein
MVRVIVAARAAPLQSSPFHPQERSKMRLKLLSAAVLAASLMTTPAQAAIQHVVIFRYKPNVSAATKAEFGRRFLALKSEARRNGRPYIVNITGGHAISREGFDRKLEEGFIVTFKSAADRDYFVGAPYSKTMDPAHKALGSKVLPLLARAHDGSVDGIFVFDFDDAALRR